MSANAVIKLSPLEKSFGTNAVLRDINLEVSKGEVISVIGSSGSGKSTLLQHLNGLLKPSDGKIFLDGKNIHDSKSTLYDARFRVGLCFQYPEYQLFEETVYKDIAFGPTNMGLSKAEIDERVRNAAKYVGIPNEMLEKSPFDLSGGEKRRVAIAGVISMEPEILILDDSASALDYATDAALRAAIGNLPGDMTVVIVSQRTASIQQADQILVLDDGQLVGSGVHDELLERCPVYREIHESQYEGGAQA